MYTHIVPHDIVSFVSERDDGSRYAGVEPGFARFCVMKRGTDIYEYRARGDTHRILLQHGMLACMASDWSSASQSFQKKCEHRVPPAKHPVLGGRLSWTVRIRSTDILPAISFDTLTSAAGTAVALDASDCALLAWTPKQAHDLLGLDMSPECADELQRELRADMIKHGHPDITRVFGKTHFNKGRRVLEQAHTDGQQYTYGGKTTQSGKAFGPVARRVLQSLAHTLGLPDSACFWAHLVYYPTPDCKLAWHQDAEKGINPHLIFSMTFLDDPIHGARPFDVRLKKQKVNTPPTRTNKRAKM